MPIKYYSKGVTEHARNQMVAKGAPIVNAVHLINALKRYEAEEMRVEAGRVGIKLKNHPSFIYILNHKEKKKVKEEYPIIITVLKIEEYENQEEWRKNKTGNG